MIGRRRLTQTSFHFSDALDNLTSNHVEAQGRRKTVSCSISSPVISIKTYMSSQKGTRVAPFSVRSMLLEWTITALLSVTVKGGRLEVTLCISSRSTSESAEKCFTTTSLSVPVRPVPRLLDQFLAFRSDDLHAVQVCHLLLEAVTFGIPRGSRVFVLLFQTYINANPIDEYGVL